MSFTIRMSDGDIDIGPGGEQTWIGSAEKAAQDLVEEILLPYENSRDRGNELFEPDGSLTSIAGSIVVGTASIKSFLKNATTRLMRAQADDPGTSESELIQTIRSLVVENLDRDVTSYGFFLAVTVDDELIGVAREVSLRHLGDTTRPLLGGYDP